MFHIPDHALSKIFKLDTAVAQPHPVASQKVFSSPSIEAYLGKNQNETTVVSSVPKEAPLFFFNDQVPQQLAARDAFARANTDMNPSEPNPYDSPMTYHHVSLSSVADHIEGQNEQLLGAQKAYLRFNSVDPNQADPYAQMIADNAVFIKDIQELKDKGIVWAGFDPRNMDTGTLRGMIAYLKREADALPKGDSLAALAEINAKLTAAHPRGEATAPATAPEPVVAAATEEPVAETAPAIPAFAAISPAQDKAVQSNAAAAKSSMKWMAGMPLLSNQEDVRKEIGKNGEVVYIIKAEHYDTTKLEFRSDMPGVVVNFDKEGKVSNFDVTGAIMSGALCDPKYVKNEELRKHYASLQKMYGAGTWAVPKVKGTGFFAAISKKLVKVFNKVRDYKNLITLKYPMKGQIRNLALGSAAGGLLFLSTGFGTPAIAPVNAVDLQKPTTGADYVLAAHTGAIPAQSMVRQHIAETIQKNAAAQPAAKEEQVAETQQQKNVTPPPAKPAPAARQHHVSLKNTAAKQPPASTPAPTKQVKENTKPAETKPVSAPKASGPSAYASLNKGFYGPGFS